jgi:hypothetical protein
MSYSFGRNTGDTQMKIEKVEWNKYNLSFEDQIEAWVTAEDMLAVMAALIVVKAAEPEDSE